MIKANAKLRKIKSIKYLVYRKIYVKIINEQSNNEYSDLDMLEILKNESMDCFEEDEDRDDDVMELTNNISFRITMGMLIVWPSSKLKHYQ